MSATTSQRLTKYAGITPARGAYPIAADVAIYKGTIVGLNSSGQAVPGDTIANGCNYAVGVASATYDNTGGSAAAYSVEVEFGVFAFASKSGGGDDIAVDDIGKACFCYDNQTVALTNGSDTRGQAGMIVDVIGTDVYVYMGPHVAGLVAVAASEASQLDQAQADILELQNTGMVPIPLTSALDIATGALCAVFADGASTTPGTQFVNSKAVVIRWNNHATPGAIGVCVPMPPDLDDAQDVTFHALVSKSGATVGDATKLTVAAFEQTVGALHDADVDFGGDTTALTGNATAKTVTELTLTLDKANIHAVPSAITLTIKPKAGTLGTDDLFLHAAWLKYTRAAG